MLALTALALFAFAPIRHNGFVNWDDQQNLVDNDAFKGFAWENLTWMFTTFHGGHYQPLSWLSLALDYTLWGGAAAGYHLTNVLLHLAASVVFFLVAKRLLILALGQTPVVNKDRTLGKQGVAEAHRPATHVDANQSVLIGSAFAAAVFAVHPLRVESVAWATERRDVLSGLLLMLAVLAYIKAAQACNRARYVRHYVASIAWYATSLLAKAAGMTLPFVLLLFDNFPLRRLRTSNAAGPGPKFRTLLLEKLPYVALAVPFSLAAARAQQAAGAMWSLEDHPLALRISQAFYGLVFYPLRTLLPLGLSPLYEQDPQATAQDAANVISCIALITFTAFAVAVRRKLPGLLAALIAYVLLIAPVLGLAQSGPQLVADRYSYLACLPWALVIGWCMQHSWARLQPARRAGLGLVAGVTILAMVIATRAQVGVWKDSKTLWRTVIQRGGSDGLAYANLASAYLQEGDYLNAGKLAATALKTLPGNRTAHSIIGRCAFASGRLDVATKHLLRAVRIGEAVKKPDLGGLVVLVAALQKHDASKVADWTHRATSLMPDPNYYFRQGQLLAQNDRTPEAIAYLKFGLGMSPTAAEVRILLARLLCNQGDRAQAIRILEEGLQIPGSAPQLGTELAWLIATAEQPELRDLDRATHLIQAALAAEVRAAVRIARTEAAIRAAQGDFADAAARLSRLAKDAAAEVDPKDRTALDAQRKAYTRGELWHGCE